MQLEFLFSWGSDLHFLVFNAKDYDSSSYGFPILFHSDDLLEMRYKLPRIGSYHFSCAVR